MAALLGELTNAAAKQAVKPEAIAEAGVALLFDQDLERAGSGLFADGNGY
jgi:hypothetical protein